MDLAIPVRMPDGPFDSGFERLRYVARTFWHHFPEPGRIFVACPVRPPWATERVVWLPTPQKGSKFQNIGEALDAVLASDISEEFIWSNDDIFWLRNVPAPMPLYASGPIRERIRTWLEHDHNAKGHKAEVTEAFCVGMRTQAKIAVAWGYSVDSPCTDLHVPMIVDKTELKEVLARRDDTGIPIERGHFRMLYGLGKETQVIGDKKKKAGLLPEVDDEFVSTSEASWHNNAGQLIRNRYWRTSIYEREYQPQ